MLPQKIGAPVDPPVWMEDDHDLLFLGYPHTQNIQLGTHKNIGAIIVNLAWQDLEILKLKRIN